jgi:hypothetical protein
MLIFPPDVRFQPELLSRMSGIDYAFMQHMLQAGCPTTDTGLSYEEFVQWTTGHCVEALPDYEVATLPRDGHFSETLQYWILAPIFEWVLHEKGNWLAVGGPGVDGISWALLKNRRGLFAFYPIEKRFVSVAENAPDLILKWTSGSLRV